MQSKSEEYRLNAVICVAVAEQVSNPAIKADLLGLAQAWRALADQAERNSKTDVVYETPESRAAGQIQPGKE